MRKVYELSANLKEGSLLSFDVTDDVDQFKGAGKVNVVRVRCPTQYAAVDPGALNVTGQTPIKVDNYTSPAEALRNYEKVFQEAVFENGTGTTGQSASTANTTFREYVVSNTTGSDITGATLSIGGSESYKVTLPTIPDSESVTVSAYPQDGAVLIPNFPPGHTATVSAGTLTATDYDFMYLPTLQLENDVLKLTSEKTFDYDDAAAYRLKLGGRTATSKAVVHLGTSEPAFNDVRRIVMDLTPSTQKVVARHVQGQKTEKVYDKASLSFTVDDDPTNNSTFAIYSLSGDFEVNSLPLDSTVTGSTYGFKLERVLFDPITGDLLQQDLHLPDTNNFVEVKVVLDSSNKRAYSAIDG